MTILFLFCSALLAVATLLIFDTRQIAVKYFLNYDRNKTVYILRIIGYIMFIVGIVFLRILAK